VTSQLTGVPQRLIVALVTSCRQVNEAELYKLGEVVAAFSTESGQRLLRKLHQNQLHLYANCRVTWRDDLGTLHTAEDAYVEIRGKRAEVTLRSGYRTIVALTDSTRIFRWRFFLMEAISAKDCFCYSSACFFR